MFAVILIICKYFNINCIFYKITGYICPACGMTRAVASLIKGDISGYIEYNVFALPTAIVIVAAVFEELLGKYKKAIFIASAISLSVNFIYYLCRLFNIFDIGIPIG